MSTVCLDQSYFNDHAFAAPYHAARPLPPPAFLDLLCRYARTERPRLIVDLGCGTGISAFVWADRAERVVGIESAPDTSAIASPVRWPPPGTQTLLGESAPVSAGIVLYVA